MDVCKRISPPLVEIAPGHSTACHLYYEVDSSGSVKPGTTASHPEKLTTQRNTIQNGTIQNKTT
jgi:hypothetical protein